MILYLHSSFCLISIFHLYLIFPLFNESPFFLLSCLLPFSSFLSHCLFFVSPPLSFDPPRPPVTWLLLISSQQSLFNASFRSYFSLWWSGSSRGCWSLPSAVAQDQSLSPGRVRLITGLFGWCSQEDGGIRRVFCMVDACVCQAVPGWMVLAVAKMFNFCHKYLSK